MNSRERIETARSDIWDMLSSVDSLDRGDIAAQLEALADSLDAALDTFPDNMEEATA